MRLLLILATLLFAFMAEAHAAPASLKGSRHALAQQNKMADRLDLSRITEKQLPVFKRKGLLVPLPQGRSVKIDRRLPSRYRWVRPMTHRFIVQISSAFYAEFRDSLCVNSAVRTVEYQNKLIKRNGNAARGDKPLTRSSHLTGATIDFGKKCLTSKQVKWLRKRLMKNEKVARAESTEEFRQPVFHVVVFR